MSVINVCLWVWNNDNDNGAWPAFVSRKNLPPLQPNPSTPRRLQRNHRHPRQRNDRPRHIPARQRNAINNAQPDQGHGDIHAAIRGIGSSGGGGVQGQQPGEQGQGGGGGQE